MLGTGLLVLPGVLTPSKVMLARRLGVQAMKLFPGSSGGPSYLKALRGPFPDILFVPTGVVSVENVADWFAAGALAVGAGGALAPRRHSKARPWRGRREREPVRRGRARGSGAVRSGMLRRRRERRADKQSRGPYAPSSMADAMPVMALCLWTTDG